MEIGWRLSTLSPGRVIAAPVPSGFTISDSDFAMRTQFFFEESADWAPPPLLMRVVGLPFLIVRAGRVGACRATVVGSLGLVTTRASEARSEVEARRV